MVNNKIFSTTDYDKFNRFTGNRSVTSVKGRHHIDKLIESYKQNYLPSPIIVNEDMKVLDGQHRLEAARALKLPVYFIKLHEPVTVLDIQRINNITSKWDTADYLSSNMEVEKEKYPTSYHQKPYHTYDWFRKTYKFSHRNNLEMLVDRYDEVKANSKFRDGKLKIASLEGAKSQAVFIHSFKHLITQFNYNNRAFVSAMLKAMSHYRFNRKTWVQKVNMNSRKLVRCTTKSDYLKCICDVYNWNNRIKIKFDD